MLLTNLFPLQYKVSNTMNRPTNKFNRSVSTSHVQKINDVESPQPKKQRNASTIPIIRPSSSVKQRKFKLPTLPGNWKQYFRSNTASTTSTGELSKEEDCIPSPKNSVSKSHFQFTSLVSESIDSRLGGSLYNPNSASVGFVRDSVILNRTCFALTGSNLNNRL